MQLSGMETASYKIERPDYNSREGYMVVPRSADEPREPLGAPAPEGGHGHYDVVFTLSVPGKDVFTTDLVLGQAVSRGDSLVAFPETISSYEVYLKGNGEDIGSIVLLKNFSGPAVRSYVRSFSVIVSGSGKVGIRKDDIAAEFPDVYLRCRN